VRIIFFLTIYSIRLRVRISWFRVSSLTRSKEKQFSMLNDGKKFWSIAAVRLVLEGRGQKF
jgi:hypothetical protein